MRDLKQMADAMDEAMGADRPGARSARPSLDLALDLAPAQALVYRFLPFLAAGFFALAGLAGGAGFFFTGACFAAGFACAFVGGVLPFAFAVCLGASFFATVLRTGCALADFAGADFF